MDATTTDEQSKVQTAKDEAMNQARSVAETAGEQTKQVVSDVAEEVKGQLGDQKAKIASTIREIGDELDQAAQNSSGTVAGIAGQAADTTRQISSWIDTHDARDVLGEIEDFARQRPVVFVLGAAALGFLVGRVTRNAVASARDNSGQTIDLRQEAAFTAPVGGSGVTPSDPHLTGEPADAAVLSGPSGPLQRGFEGDEVAVGDVLPGVDTTTGREHL